MLSSTFTNFYEIFFFLIFVGRLCSNSLKEKRGGKKRKNGGKNIRYWTNEIRFPIKGISRIDWTEFSNINISLFTTCAFYRRFLLYSLIFLRRKMNDGEREREGGSKKQNTHTYDAGHCKFLLRLWRYEFQVSSLRIVRKFEHVSAIWLKGHLFRVPLLEEVSKSAKPEFHFALSSRVLDSAKRE